MARDPSPDEQTMVDNAARTLRLPEDDLEWIRWVGKGRFVRECREGDSLIQIWRSSKAKRPSAVYRSTPVLLKQRTKRWTRFYPETVTGQYAQLPWGKFQRLLRKLGYRKRVGPAIMHLVDPEMADAIARSWNSAAKL